MTTERRHPTERTTDEISAMITQENDPKQRAFLIVLNSINQSLQANTDTTKDVASKLDRHLSDYQQTAIIHEAMINKGRGAWTVGAWVLGMVQLAVLASAGFVTTELKQLGKETVENGQIHAAMEREIQVMHDHIRTLDGARKLP